MHSQLHLYFYCLGIKHLYSKPLDTCTYWYTMVLMSEMVNRSHQCWHFLYFIIHCQPNQASDRHFSCSGILKFKRNVCHQRWNILCFLVTNDLINLGTRRVNLTDPNTTFSCPCIYKYSSDKVAYWWRHCTFYFYYRSVNLGIMGVNLSALDMHLFC